MVMAVRVRARLAALAGVSGRGTLANDGVRRQHVDEQRWREAWRRLEAMVSDAAARRTWARRVARRQPCNVVSAVCCAKSNVVSAAWFEHAPVARLEPKSSALSWMRCSRACRTCVVQAANAILTTRPNRRNPSKRGVCNEPARYFGSVYGLLSKTIANFLPGPFQRMPTPPAASSRYILPPTKFSCTLTAI